MSAHSKALALLLLTPLVLSACERAAPQGDGDSAGTAQKEDAPAPAAMDAWRGKLVGVDGDGKVEMRRHGARAFEPLTLDMAVPASATLRTDEATRARVMLEPGAGELVLNHSSQLVLLRDGPGASLARGHVIISTPQASQGGEARKARVDTPTGSVVLMGTRVSVLAGATQSSVSVAQGEVESLGGEPVRARFGEQILLPRDEQARVLHVPELAAQFGWRGFDEPGAQFSAPERGMGKLVAHAPGSESERALELKQHKVRVSIQGMMAYTEVTEVFHNPSGEQLEGLYRFPMPEDAQISRLALKVGDRIMEGQFLETARAERIWREVTVEQRRDPALLQWKQGNQFELRIFPIEPHSSRQVTIGYVQRLASTGQGYRYTYPMPVDHTGQAHTKAFDFVASVEGHAAQQPVSVRGYTGATVEPGASARVSLARADFRPTGALSVDFALPAEQKQVSIHAYDPGKSEDGYVAISVRPEVARTAAIKARDFVIIMDRSYGRMGAAMSLQRAMVESLIDEMDPMDRVRILACNHRCEAVGEKRFKQASRAELAAELSGLSQVSATGSSNLITAMQSAAQLFGRRAAGENPAHIIYMTDGIASAGALNPGTLGKATERVLQESGAQMSVVSLGGEQDMANMQAMARAARGQVVSVSGERGLMASALDILRYHYGASLQEIAVELPVGIEQVYPLSFENILPGEEILVLGRMTQERVTGKIKLRGKLGAQSVQQEWSMDVKAGKSAGNSFVPRLWASAHIQELERSGQDWREEIVKLSKRFGILTRYTTLLALESEEMMREFSVGHQRHIDWKGQEAAAEEGAEAVEKTRTTTTRTALGKGAPADLADRDQLATASAGGAGPGLLDSISSGAADDDEDLAELSEPKKDAKPTRAPATSSAKRTKPLEKPHSSNLGSWDKREVSRRSRGYGGRNYYHQQVTRPVEASALSKDDERLIERRERAYRADPKNRTARMRYIRALMRGDVTMRAQAHRAINEWLELNAMDSEAVVLRGQVALNEGKIEEALSWLNSSMDAAARARWLQERLHKAHLASGDEAMACAHEVSLQELAARAPKSPRDVLTCPMATPEGALFEGGAPLPAPVAQVNEKMGRYGARVTAEWAEAGDVDIVLVEPDGRLLSWMSQRRGLKVSCVRGPACKREQLMLPSPRSGTHSVRIVRHDAGTSPLRVRLSISSGGKTYSPVVDILAGESLEVAELVRTTIKRRY